MYFLLRLGKGLPASSVEISLIERLRARRTKIVIEREIRQWQIREDEICLCELFFIFARGQRRFFRLQSVRQRLFTKDLHTYIDLDEDLTYTLSELSAYRSEKRFHVQHERLETEASRSPLNSDDRRDSLS